MVPKPAILILGASLLVLSGCAGAAEPPAEESAAATPSPTLEFGSIAGTVLDTEGRPIVGGQVAILGSEVQTATDASGGYTLNDVAPGTHVIAFASLGFQSLSREVVVEAGAVAALDVVLETIEIFAEPIISTVIYEGHIRCGWNPYYSLNTCGELLGGNTNNWAFTLDPGMEFFRGIMEVTWQPTTAVTGQELEIDICPPQDEATEGNAIMCQDAFSFASGSSPVRLEVTEGTGGPFSDEVPWPDMLDYEMWVGSGFMSPNPAYDQRFTVYFTVCYIDDCEDFSAVPGS